jgi:uncharacterized protein YlxP (DUF503 family)
MVVGIVRIELHIPAAQSLKDKRQVVRGLKDRIHERVKAAVAEVDHQDLWQRAALGVAVVAADGGHVHELLQSVRRLVEQTYAAELTDWQERLEQ